MMKYVDCIIFPGLGCSFLTERCVNKSVYPYLCDTRSVCTFDHLSKVTVIVDISDNVCVHLWYRVPAILARLALMIAQ